MKRSARKTFWGVREDNEYCPTTKKTCFDKRGAITARNARLKESHEKLRVYSCSFCGFWHLTSQDLITSHPRLMDKKYVYKINPKHEED